MGEYLEQRVNAARGGLAGYWVLRRWMLTALCNQAAFSARFRVINHGGGVMECLESREIVIVTG